MTKIVNRERSLLIKKNAPSQPGLVHRGGIVGQPDSSLRRSSHRRHTRLSRDRPVVDSDAPQSTEDNERQPREEGHGILRTFADGRKGARGLDFRDAYLTAPF